MQNASSRSCPVCGSIGGRKVMYHQRFQEGLLGKGYDVVICKHCGAGFADGIPTQAELNRYYSHASNYAKSETPTESPYDLRRFEMTVNQLKSVLPESGARILEVGCATGALLSMLRSAGYSNVFGADPSAECAQVAQTRHNLDVRVATLDELAGWSERFDAILLLGVLEHVRDTSNAISVLRKLLSPNSFIYLAVPDVEGLVASRNAPYQQFSMEHLNFFSAQSLSRMMNENGFIQRNKWHYTVEWREQITEPIVSATFEVKTSPFSSSVRIDADEGTEQAIEQYLDVSSKADQEIRKMIAGLIETQEPLIVWGAGALARRLLATCGLDRANITLFVDSNTHLIGQHLVGIPIIAPTSLGKRRERIFICSSVFQHEIEKYVRMELKLENGIITVPS
jgi:2-polyprenyl-3-methyl-5-hydroxy-6-metoxy-1,4-benzoquinol methylase